MRANIVIVEEYILLRVLLHVFVGLKRTWDMKLALVVDQGIGVLNLAISGTEDADFAARAATMKTWMGAERFKYTTHPYKVEDVVKPQGTFPTYFNGYPYDTVPNKVDRLFHAQFFHDRKQYEELRRMSADKRAKLPMVDYLSRGYEHRLRRPHRHDEAREAVCGERGGIHIEDQKSGVIRSAVTWRARGWSPRRSTSSNRSPSACRLTC